MADGGLPRRERLRGRETIRRVLDRGRTQQDTLLLLRYLPTDLGRRRVGVAASRVRSAAGRNRIKRRLRHIYRAHRDDLPPSGDFFIIGRSDAADVPYRDLSASFQKLARALAD